MRNWVSTAHKDARSLLTFPRSDWIFLFLTVLYAFDLLVRFHGLGFKSFRANGWNLFDLVVITGSFATTIPALQAAISGLPGSEVNLQLQKLFLVSISLKLVQRISSLNQLFKTSVYVSLSSPLIMQLSGMPGRAYRPSATCFSSGRRSSFSTLSSFSRSSV